MQVERRSAVAHVDHEVGASIKVLVQAVETIRSTEGSSQDFKAFDLAIEHRPDCAGFPELNLHAFHTSSTYFQMISTASSSLFRATTESTFQPRSPWKPACSSPWTKIP